MVNWDPDDGEVLTFFRIKSEFESSKKRKLDNCGEPLNNTIAYYTIFK